MEAVDRTLAYRIYPSSASGLKDFIQNEPAYIIKAIAFGALAGLGLYLVGAPTLAVTAVVVLTGPALCFFNRFTPENHKLANR
jgi:hypothetical protein